MSRERVKEYLKREINKIPKNEKNIIWIIE